LLFLPPAKEATRARSRAPARAGALAGYPGGRAESGSLGPGSRARAAGPGDLGL